MDSKEFTGTYNVLVQLYLKNLSRFHLSHVVCQKKREGIILPGSPSTIPFGIYINHRINKMETDIDDYPIVSVVDLMMLSQK